MWRQLTRGFFGIAAVIGVLVGWYVFSFYFGSYHLIYECNGSLKERSTDVGQDVIAHMDLEQFHWFKLRLGAIDGDAEIEMTDPRVFEVFYISKAGSNHVDLYPVPASGAVSEQSGSFSSLSQNLVVEVANGLVFDGLCSVRK